MDKIMEQINAVTDIPDIEIEKYIVDDDIDINDYIPESKESNFVPFDLFNVFTCYYKQLYQVKQEASMLDGTDADKNDSTNRCIELFYEEIHKFRISDDPNKDVVYSPDDEDIDYDNSNEIFVVHMNSEPTYATKYMLPLLRYISELNWLEIDWSIVKLK